MKKVGILGGTYNPPHVGHLIIASEVKHALGLDEVRFMPTAEPPHKAADETVTEEQRLDMVQLATEGIEGFVSFPYEIDRGGVSYTFDTIKSLRKEEPDVAFYFIIGGDMIDQLDKWHRIDELIDLITFVGVNRPGWKSETTYPVELVDIPEIDLSSTFIRERFEQNGPVTFLIPPAVEEFIRKEGLYGAHERSVEGTIDS